VGVKPPGTVAVAGMLLILIEVDARRTSIATVALVDLIRFSGRLIYVADHVLN